MRCGYVRCAPLVQSNHPAHAYPLWGGGARGQVTSSLLLWLFVATTTARVIILQREAFKDYFMMYVHESLYYLIFLQVVASPKRCGLIGASAWDTGVALRNCSHTA